MAAAGVSMSTQTALETSSQWPARTTTARSASVQRLDQKGRRRGPTSPSRSASTSTALTLSRPVQRRRKSPSSSPESAFAWKPTMGYQDSKGTARRSGVSRAVSPTSTMASLRRASSSAGIEGSIPFTAR
jgi:hypothetical protein